MHLRGNSSQRSQRHFLRPTSSQRNLGTPQKQQKQFLSIATVSKKKEKNTGIRLERRQRISMDILYTEEALKVPNSEARNNNMHSNTSVSKPWSPNTDRLGSTRHCSSLEGSKCSSRNLQSQTNFPATVTVKQQEIYSTYYPAEESTKGSSRVQTEYGFVFKGHRPLVKKYNIQGVIQY